MGSREGEGVEERIKAIEDIQDDHQEILRSPEAMNKVYEQVVSLRRVCDYQ